MDFTSSIYVGSATASGASSWVGRTGSLMACSRVTSFISKCSSSGAISWVSFGFVGTFSSIVVVSSLSSFDFGLLCFWWNLITLCTAGCLLEFSSRSTSLGPADAGSSPVGDNLFADVPSITGDLDVSSSLVLKDLFLESGSLWDEPLMLGGLLDNGPLFLCRAIGSSDMKLSDLVSLGSCLVP